MSVCIYECVYMSVYECVYMSVCIYECVYMCVYEFVYMSVYECVYTSQNPGTQVARTTFVEMNKECIFFKGNSY